MNINTGVIAKFLVSAVGSVVVGLTGHSFTADPAIASYIASALVYLIPNMEGKLLAKTTKVAPLQPPAQPPMPPR